MRHMSEQRKFTCVINLRFVPRRVQPSYIPNPPPRPILSGELEACAEQKSDNIKCTSEELALRSLVIGPDGKDKIADLASYTPCNG